MFDFLKSPPYQDNQLGTLERRSGYWTGSVTLPPAGTFTLQLHGGRRSPDPAALNLARQLPTEFPALVDRLQDELFAHCEPYRDGSNEVPRIERPDQVWAYVSPVHVLVKPLRGVPTLEIALTVDWDEEHTVGALIQDWKLVVFSGSV